VEDFEKNKTKSEKYLFFEDSASMSQNIIAHTTNGTSPLINC
jgi:hypothetical protein